MKLINGECLEEMAKMPAESIDLILCDLPYGTTDRTGGTRLFAWDCVIDPDELWAQYKRILKLNGNVVLTADQPFTSQLVMSNIGWFKYDLIWNKCRVNGFLHANSKPMKQTEDILVFSPLGAAPASRKNGTHMTYNPQGLIPVSVKKKNSQKRLGKFLNNPDHMGSNNKLLGESEYEQKWTNYPKEIIEFPLDKNSFHPTQKPVALMEYLIRTYSNEGGVVLDNCMGSGSTGVAAVRSNRDFIGIEMDDNYFNKATDFIKSEPTKLF